MQIANGKEQYWQKTKDTNKDPYGSAVIRYIERWTGLMEKRLAQGDRLEEIAGKTSQEANTESITRFMYACAVQIIAKVWTHGEQLRCWHNLKTQLLDEGEKANESGGVLNPALIRYR